MARGLRRLWIGLAASCCLALCLMPAPAQAQARVCRALLIGVDSFVTRESTYPSSTNNVFAMQEVFQASAESFASILAPAEPVTDAEALTRLIRRAFAGAKENDVSYLYLSTHGVYDPDSGEEPALLLSDGATENRVTPSQLEAAFEGIAGVKVLLLDACNSGAFIGKGMKDAPETPHFLGPEFKVLCSSGAMEESWYWSVGAGNADAQQGAFYFTQTLSQGLSPGYGFAADQNSDGSVTLTELYEYLLRNHAASTPQVYPQTDDFVVFRYDPAPVPSVNSSPVRDITFSAAALSRSDPELTLEFIAVRPVRVAYQIVRQREGKWRFDESELIYDDAERYTAYGDEEGAVSPGRKVRTLSLDLGSAESSGYLIIQLVTIERSKLTVHAGRVLCIPPETGDLLLGVETRPQYTLGGERELAVYVRHAYPCLLSVAIVNEAGEVVRRLCHRQSTRPMQLVPEGSTFYWDGRDRSGELVPEGTYYVRVSGLMDELTFTVVSEGITARSDQG